MNGKYVIWFENLRISDIEKVGGKNASLGEMISQLSSKNIRIPTGFATTSEAYKIFLSQNNLSERISNELKQLNINNIKELSETGKKIRQWIVDTPFPKELENDLKEAWDTLVKNSNNNEKISVAVRSSATAEDLPNASFAGQQETFLNIQGYENVKEAILHVFASLYNDRAISYREHKNFDHDKVFLSAGIQKMVRSDNSSSGVMFTMDTESGFDKVVFITSSYGLGETIVQGAVNPDEFYVYKPNLKNKKPAILRKILGTKLIKMIFTDNAKAGTSVKTIDVNESERTKFSINEQEIEELAKYAVTIEEHYKKHMDIEWGKDGQDGKIYILQARPETVKSQENKKGVLQTYNLKNKSKILCKGRAIGQKAGQGKVKIVKSLDQMSDIKPGEILVTDMTDPDWEPVMKKASAIVTNRGGRTCHAAIIARELGIPAVVGCANATKILNTGDEVTVSCTEGDVGNIYEGLLNIEIENLELNKMPKLPVKIMMNVGNPELAFNFSSLPNEGIGLARMEFIINRQIGIHPKALLEYDKLPSALKNSIDSKIAGYPSAVDFYIDKIAEGISTLAASVYPKKVIIRLSDFKSNEYANLIGGNKYEPDEENPMLGYRGAVRYISPDFRECFDLECKAIKKARDIMGFTNIEIMIPFVRTINEANLVIEALKDNDLERGKNKLKIIMMSEIPGNAILAEQFLEYFDGFSIGSNDMTQLTLGIDRDAGGNIANLFDERNPAVKVMLSLTIKACKKHNKYVGICGQGPSDHEDLAKWLVDEGIESISLNPDTVIKTWLYLAKEFINKN